MVLLVFIGGQGEPYSLPLLFAMLENGFPLASLLLFLLSGVFSFSLVKFAVYALQAGILGLFFLLYRKIGGHSLLLCLIPLALAAACFFCLFPLEEYALLSFLPLWGQKVVTASVLFILSPCFDRALNILLKKLLRCRLSGEEFLFVILFVLSPCLGLYRLGGSQVYFAIALFAILLSVSLFKNTACIALAALLALPAAVAESSLLPVALFVLISGMGMFFYPAGRFPCVFSVCVLYLLHCFFTGVFDGVLSGSDEEILPLLLHILSCITPCIVFLLLPQKRLKEWEKKLVFYRENHLSRAAINRNRSAIGERLFCLSDVFRKIENAFACITKEEQSEEEVIRLIRENTEKKVCDGCPRVRECRRLQEGEGLNKLIAVGCAKGKVSIIDLPMPLATACAGTNGILYCVNGQLSEYRKYKMEADNARMSRQLLASQAKGVSELLKDIALQESEPLTGFGEREKELNAAFHRCGIICQEILVYGEDEELTVSLTVFGSYDSAVISRIASEVMGVPLLASEKLVLAADKFCFTLRKKPKFDAAFGVATKQKEGQRGNGDAHSVIRIDEKRFLAVLSDGMGSGERAARISESALSLLESFYRAGMPGETVLSTVNKLLTFHREEAFACLDVAAVDLDSGTAEIVKIGSPLAFIFSQGNLRVLEGDGLPLGMLDEVHPTVFSVPLHADDVMVFLSDGVTDAFGSSTDLLDYLKKKAPLNPQALADDILSAALRRTDNIAEDDMTALAVRLFIRNSPTRA
jgi:stage II sporulation protein E